MIITARNADRVHRAGLELEASIAAFDATDFHRLERFFNELPAPVDHVLVTCPGAHSAPLAEFDVEAARSSVDAHLILPLQVARNAATKFAQEGHSSSPVALMTLLRPSVFHSSRDSAPRFMP